MTTQTVSRPIPRRIGRWLAFGALVAGALALSGCHAAHHRVVHHHKPHVGYGHGAKHAYKHGFKHGYRYGHKHHW